MFKAILLFSLFVPGLVFAEASKADLGRAPDLDADMGVYRVRFNNDLVDGSSYRAVNVLKLVKRSPKEASFDLHLEFFNGHECNLAGTAILEADALTHRSKGLDGPCVLKIRRRKDGIGIEDVDNQCRAGSCGLRGGYGNGTETVFPSKSLRKVPNAKRHKAIEKLN